MSHFFFLLKIGTCYAYNSVKCFFLSATNFFYERSLFLKWIIASSKEGELLRDKDIQA